MILICPVRPGDTNEELRYALRSWETNLHPEDVHAWEPGIKLLTVGYKPSWLEPDHHVEGNHYKSMPLAVFDNIRLGSEAALDYGLDGQDVIYMNDDFFCLDPVGAILPVRRNSTLADHIAQFPPNASTWWTVSLRLTASWLAEAGFPHPWSYEVHRPLAASPRGMLEALDQWDGGMTGPVPQWRTLYGALNKVEAYPAVDAKLGPRSPGTGTPWLSTSDQTWRRYGPEIKKRFQKPSRWER